MIKMIAGTCSYKDKGIIKLKTAEDGPFHLSEAEEKHLVERGVAVYVGGLEEEIPDVPPSWDGIPEYHADMKAEELRAIAKLMGLSFKAGTSKVDMVAAMDEYMDKHMDDSLPDETPPSFDPTEAVK